MTRNRLMQIILASTSILIIVGVAILGGMSSGSGEKNVFKVSLEKNETQTLKFENLHLIPGESCEYTVKLKGDSKEPYDIALDFVELEDKSLKNYAFVKIFLGEELLYEECLASAFDCGDTILHIDFSDSRHKDLRIVYYLPIDVGNEAKNAESLFELKFTAMSK